MKSSEVTIVIFTEYSRAFNTIDFSILIKKIHTLNFFKHVSVERKEQYKLLDIVIDGHFEPYTHARKFFNDGCFLFENNEKTLKVY